MNMKPVTLEELEVQLGLAKDRVFVMKYYKLEESNYSLAAKVELLESENKRLKAAYEIDKKFNPSERLCDNEKSVIIAAITFYRGNKTQAAESLGITVKTLYNKLHEYGILDKY